MSTPDDTPSARRCTKCGTEYPATTEYFYKKQDGRDGLASACIPCTKSYWKTKDRSEYQHHYHAKNAESRREYNRAYRAANVERVREHNRDYMREYVKTPAGKAAKRASAHNHRTRKIAAGKLSAAEIIAIRAAQTDKSGKLNCWWCGKPIKGTPHLDHKIALASGGSNDAGNLCYACKPCNQSKGAKPFSEWAGRLL